MEATKKIREAVEVKPGWAIVLTRPGQVNSRITIAGLDEEEAGKRLARAPHDGCAAIRDFDCRRSPASIEAVEILGPLGSKGERIAGWLGLGFVRRTLLTVSGDSKSFHP